MTNNRSSSATAKLGGFSVGPLPVNGAWQTKIGYYLVSRPIGVKAAIAVIVDSVVLAVSMFFAIVLTRFHFSLEPTSIVTLLVVGPLVTVGCQWVFGAYRAVVRFIDMKFVERCLLGTLTASVLLYTLFRLFSLPSSGRAFITYTFVGFVALMVTRRAAARFLRPFLKQGNRTNILIYGAGDAGTQLAAALDINSQFHAVGFVDDGRELHGRIIRGLRVHSSDELFELKKQLKFERVLLAIPSAGRSKRRKILERLESLSVQVLVMPGLEDLASGRKAVDELREVQVEDILDRDPIAPVDALLDQCILGRSVMVTGAGGSIGSELCRQIVKRGASRLVLFDASEYALYAIGQELQLSAAFQSRCEIVSVLASILDRDLVARSIRDNVVETIYHAAAYKHVPLVESNVISAVKNNITGTLNVVEEAIKNAVKNLVLVSTDKAVRPTNVMGASKRVCELIVQAQAQRHPHIRMTMVRFGNVLASSGSVVPLFRKQISNGGPVTVTHPEVTRYFMTISEAALLVIQAGSMGVRGEVFVLDMGRPIKILDLARRMIHLSGLDIRDSGSDEGDIEIRFTGLRPGEKLYEELLIADHPQKTQHPRIFKAQEDFLGWEVLSQLIEQLNTACLSHDIEAVIKFLSTLVTGFSVNKIESDRFPSPEAHHEVDALGEDERQRLFCKEA
jgi:FlaA1/EpsC-like NDP-sugar epimerase